MLIYLRIGCVIFCSLGLYCCRPHEQETEIVEPIHPATSAVIFLHGTGESGTTLKNEVESLFGSLSQYPNTRFIFPTAKPITCSLFPWRGQLINTWIDADEIKLDPVMDYELLNNSLAELNRWVEDQEASGIPRKRICVVGYSSGGVVALTYGYQKKSNIGCIGSLNSFIPLVSDTYQELSNKWNDLQYELPPLFIFSGGLDYIVSVSLVERTVDLLKSFGVSVTHQHHWRNCHFLSKEALDGVFQFLAQTIAP